MKLKGGPSGVITAKHSGIPTSENVTSSIHSFSSTVARCDDVQCQPVGTVT